ncbi:MAG: RnfABCDGE type electron transport complex subunit D [Oscillospiraceae bacterium]|nr:RnfABCDGE type electron transport complex subunit D [Oscillospiraceae bacterium]
MNQLTVSFSPHIRAKVTASRIMLDVILALCPAMVAAVWIFGWCAALVVAVTVVSCVFFEWGFQKLSKKPSTIGDLSAVVTGVLLAFNLPVGIPLWQAVFGSAVAIILVKQVFGGIGKNFANPAITARIVMLISFPVAKTTWEVVADALSSATPLELISRGDIGYLPSLMDMFLGNRMGCLGETSAIALLIGGVYLLARRVITWHIPVTFIGTVGLLTALLGEQPSYQLMAGGLLLGAFFMATDYPTSPQTPKGRIIFGIGCGLLTVLIRVYGSYPEGVSFAILFMNVLVPFINKLTMQKALGGVKV